MTPQHSGTPVRRRGRPLCRTGVPECWLCWLGHVVGVTVRVLRPLMPTAVMRWVGPGLWRHRRRWAVWVVVRECRCRRRRPGLWRRSPWASPAGPVVARWRFRGRGLCRWSWGWGSGAVCGRRVRRLVGIGWIPVWLRRRRGDLCRWRWARVPRVGWGLMGRWCVGVILVVGRWRRRMGCSWGSRRAVISRAGSVRAARWRVGVISRCRSGSRPVGDLCRLRWGGTTRAPLVGTVRGCAGRVAGLRLISSIRSISSSMRISSSVR